MRRHNSRTGQPSAAHTILASGPVTPRHQQPLELAGVAVNPMRLLAQGKAIKGIMMPEWASTEGPAQPNGGVQGVLYYNKTSKYPNCRWLSTV